MKIKATPIKGKDLLAGDLFSIAGPVYWNNHHEHGAVGEKVYIRTETPFSTAPDYDEIVYKIEILAKGD